MYRVQRVIAECSRRRLLFPSILLAVFGMLLLSHMMDSSIRYAEENVVVVRTRDPSVRVGLLTIAKNESKYLPEWACYHIAHGVDHIYIYDNNDGDHEPATVTLAPLIREGLVTVVSMPGQRGQTGGVQTASYNHWFRTFGHRGEVTWLAIWDVDEFPFFRDNSTFRAFIERQPENCGAVTLYWYQYGNGGHHCSPTTGLVMENYLRHGRNQYHLMKSVARVSAIKNLDDVHWTNLRRGFKRLNALGQEIEWGTDKTSARLGHIKHFYTKSDEDWMLKVSRGQVYGLAKRNLAEHYNAEFNEVEDTEIRDVWAAKVRTLMAEYGFPVPAPAGPPLEFSVCGVPTLPTTF